MSDIQYKYCCDENSNYIHINEVTEENRHQKQYHCIVCGKSMIARALSSKKVTPHFAHKPGTECSGNYETYLHKLGKKIILNHFNNGGEISFMRVQQLPCKNTENCLFSSKWCKGEVHKTFNIRDYYNICEEEKYINGYVADLYFSDSNNPGKEGILIEICVKHPCEPEKISSGMKIIEAQIWDESDIDYIIKNGFPEDGKKDIYKVRGQEVAIRRYPRFKFYNFKDLPRKKFSETPITKFTVNKWGDPIVSEGYAFKCDVMGKRIDNSSLAELEINTEKWFRHHHICSSYQLGLLYLFYRGFKKKNCWLCKFNKNSLCALYKKYGTPKHPTSNHAELCNCRYYCVDSELLKIDKMTIDKYIRPVFITL